MKLKILVCLSLIALVASIGPVARAQTYTYYPVPGGGVQPEAGVTVSGDYVYGTASAGGRYGFGLVFEVKHLGVLIDFPPTLSSPGSGFPTARVTFGPDGHLFGTTQGDNNQDLGSVFNLLPSSTICKTIGCTTWRENVLYIFKGGFNGPDGAHPGRGDLIWDKQGNIYGTTEEGGDPGWGTVYELQPSGNGWTETVIWNFKGQPDGGIPEGGVIFDSNGNLFGTTYREGLYGLGSVFKLTPTENGWVEISIHDFQGSSDGQNPSAGLMIDNLGNLYGVTPDGGSGGGGTIFELTPSGNGYTFNVLYSFSGTLGESRGPKAPLSMDAAGNIYGTTYGEGRYNAGSVFKLTKMQNGWVYTSLHDFNGSDGADPISNVTFDANGNLWGTASFDNVMGRGVVWMIGP